MRRTPARPKLYFSFRSPYSWLTVRRLRRAVPDAFEAVQWLPYWDPDERTSAALQARGAEFHYVQMSRAKHLYLLMDTKRLAETEAVSMAWPIDVEPHWELPHLGWLAARRAGRAEQFYDEVTAARWERAENICDPAVLAACADRAGLDPETVVGAVDDEELRDEGVGCLERAYLDDVFGIPYLKWGVQRFWGLDRLDAFLRVWRPDATAPTTAVPVAAVPGPYDTDTTGGCG